MRHVSSLLTLLGAGVFAVGCSGSPTAPSAPVANNPAATAPAVVVTPPVVTTPAPNPFLSDPRFDLKFYRMFALGETPDGSFGLLKRQAVAPSIYLRTIDDAGVAIDAGTLEATAAALINTAGSLTGVFGLAGLERGTGTKEGQTAWITVRWSDKPSQFCGTGQYGGGLIVLYPKTAGCRCGGGAAISPATVKHELGHVLGFHHTDSASDLMYPTLTACDKNPTDREIFHAAIAYSQPIGSLDPR